MSIAQKVFIGLILNCAMLLSTAIAQDPKNAPPPLPAAGTEVEYLDPRGALKKGKFVDLAPNGAVRVRIEDGSTRLFPPNRVRLPQGAANPPANTPAGVKPVENSPAATETPTTRTWTDASGQFKIEAEFIGVQDGQVQLKKTADGKVINLALEKLSAADQAIAKSLAETAGAQPGAGNPPTTPRPQATVGSPSGPSELLTAGYETKGQLTTISLEGVRKIDLFENVAWSVTPDPGPARPKFFSGVVSLPSRSPPGDDVSNRDSGLQSGGLFADAARGWLWLSLFTGLSSSDRQYRFERIDAATGKVLPAVVMPVGDHAILDFSPAGKLLVTIRSFGPVSAQILDLWQIDGERLSCVKSFQPYPGRDDGSLNNTLKFARFVDPTHLLTISDHGRLVLWNTATLQPVYELSTNIYRWGNAAVSPGGKYLAIQFGQHIHILEPLTGKLLGKTAQPADAHPLAKDSSLAFREDGAKLLSITKVGSLSDLHTWDVATGQHEKQLLAAPVSGSRVCWASDDRLLLNEQYAVDLDRGLVVCNYSGPQHASLAGRACFVANKSNVGFVSHHVINLDLPEASVLQQSRKFTADQFVAIKPGEQVALKIENASPLDTEKIRAALARQIEANGWVVAAADSAAPYSLHCKIGSPSPVRTLVTTKDDRTPTERMISFNGFRLVLAKKGEELNSLWDFVPSPLDGGVAELINGQYSTPTVEYFDELRIPKRVPDYSTTRAIFQGNFTDRGINYYLANPR